MALSHPLKFFLTDLSFLLIVLDMVAPVDYRKTYGLAQKELAELLSEKDRIEKRILVVRKSLQTFAELCEDEGIEFMPSNEADFLLRNTSLADEIRGILKATYPEYLRPHQVKTELERLGRNLSQYTNPQATIQMVLTRMIESGDVLEGASREDGKKIYRSAFPPDLKMTPEFTKAALKAARGHLMAKASREAKQKSFGGVE
jgi:hypothetical protein